MNKNKKLVFGDFTLINNSGNTAGDAFSVLKVNKL
jgi:hypothetical protein